MRFQLTTSISRINFATCKLIFCFDVLHFWIVFAMAASSGATITVELKLHKRLPRVQIFEMLQLVKR